MESPTDKLSVNSLETFLGVIVTNLKILKGPETELFDKIKVELEFEEESELTMEETVSFIKKVLQQHVEEMEKELFKMPEA